MPGRGRPQKACRSALVCRDSFRLPAGGDPAPHSLLHLVEGAHLDLANALTGDAELLGQLLEFDWMVGEAPRLEDAPVAFVQDLERRGERLTAIVELFVFGQYAFLARAVVSEPVLPFAGVFVLADRCIERRVAAEP